MPTLDEGRSLLPAEGGVPTLEDYVTAGGGEAVAAVDRAGPGAILDEVAEAGLRGRGGAGFPTGRKWRTVRGAGAETTFVVCNAAEGEPATFKDRWLMRHNPYQILEGVAVAALTIGAAGAFVALKASFERERASLQQALAELQDARLVGGVDIEIVTGPQDYLFGEEKALLEVIEGRRPLPRLLPPYQVGLFADVGSRNPTVMNNAETLAHVPSIIRRGADWFRSLGTDQSPGTMLFTVCGDVLRAGVVELELGTPLAVLVEDIAGGPDEGAAVKALFPGASAGVLTGEQLATPLSFEAMEAAGSGLGSGGFAVYSDSACIVHTTAAFSRFLHAESCAQCPACKQGCRQITGALERIERGMGTEEELETIRSKTRSVTGGSRCGLPLGEQRMMASVLEAFGDELEDHLGRTCPSGRRLPVPKLVDYDDDARKFRYEGTHSYEVGERPATTTVGSA